VRQAIGHSRRPTYVTLFMGHNDVCQNNPLDITPPKIFKDNVRKGLTLLDDNLPSGSTVYIVGIVDVTKLYAAAEDKRALGIVDCEVLWFTSLFDLFPCGTVLGPFANRPFAEWIINEYNARLKSLALEFDNKSGINYVYTDAVTNSAITEDLVSDLDCFHPSALGQRVLPEITWKEIAPSFGSVCP